MSDTRSEAPTPPRRVTGYEVVARALEETFRNAIREGRFDELLRRARLDAEKAKKKS